MMRGLPPVATRFKKGQSGNPKGRPKKVAPLISSGGGIVDRIHEFVLMEAMRPITVREGNNVETIPTVRAIMRSMMADAARGNSKSQRQALEMVMAAENARTDAARVILEGASRHKETWGLKFAEAQRDGTPFPDIQPHPADVKIGEDGSVTVEGPKSAEEAGTLKVVEMHAIRSVPKYFETQRMLQADPSNRELRREFKRLAKLLQVLEKSKNRKLARSEYAQSLLGHEIDAFAQDG